MTLTDEELEELKELIREYLDCPADGSYYKHIESALIRMAKEAYPEEFSEI